MSEPCVLAALDRKLLRDLLAMKGQAVAIALVIASGVTMFVMYLSNFQSLQANAAGLLRPAAFCRRLRLAKRAPQRLEERLAEIPGVAAVDTRVVADVTLDVPGLVRAGARAADLDSRPRSGRGSTTSSSAADADSIPLAPTRSSRARPSPLANGFEPGATVAAIINGRRRTLRLVGFALSPEYVYSIPPGEIIPDDRRFGVFWMERKALASAFDMEGGFNNVALGLMPGASSQEAIAHLDRLLAPYGGLGAIPRALQFSHWTLDSELDQLQKFGFIVPSLFLAVAAFVLNVALNRALALQRPQIAALKALGYRTTELAWHYLKWALADRHPRRASRRRRWRLARLGNDRPVQPVLPLSRSSTIVSRPGSRSSPFSPALRRAALGAFSAVRRAVRVPPAEAMRPEPPARYRPSFAERLPLGRACRTPRA